MQENDAAVGERAPESYSHIFSGSYRHSLVIGTIAALWKAGQYGKILKNMTWNLRLIPIHYSIDTELFLHPPTWAHPNLGASGKQQ